MIWPRAVSPWRPVLECGTVDALKFHYLCIGQFPSRSMRYALRILIVIQELILSYESLYVSSTPGMNSIMSFIPTETIVRLHFPIYQHSSLFPIGDFNAVQ